MPTSGDIVLLDFGVPQGHDAGLPRPAVVVTADRVLRRGAPVVQVVPLPRLGEQVGSVSTVQLLQIRELLAFLLDL